MSATDRAAAKIQAGFRGYRARKRLQQQRITEPAHQTEEEEEKEEAAAAAAAMLQPAAPTVEENKSATKIQAGIRGFLVRKRQQAEQAAATKIQAGFRGFRTRKLLKQTGQ